MYGYNSQSDTLNNLQLSIDTIKPKVEELEDDIKLLNRHDVERVVTLLKQIEKSPDTNKIFNELNVLQKRFITFGLSQDITPVFPDEDKSNFRHTFSKNGIVVVTYTIKHESNINEGGELTVFITPSGKDEYAAAKACASLNYTGDYVERIPSSTVTVPVQSGSNMRINLAESGQKKGSVLVSFHPFELKTSADHDF
ncbi:hypothetical protein [Gimesia panareensis]|uniref:hypothetical protein n=1 Tax=Gimesia panareensis TaxID=2527978 RepID=UPI0011A3B42E|nr:hypothetical protein [Gimesia panareensis]